MESELHLEWFSAGRRERAVLRDDLRIGRGPFDVALLDDPYVSRTPMVVRCVDGRPVLDASESPTQILFQGRVVRSLELEPGRAFAIGRTEMAVCLPETTVEPESGPTVAPAFTLTLHLLSRELRDAPGTVLTRLSPNECAALQRIVAAYPLAASLEAIGQAIAQAPPNEFATLRVVQRLRDRLGDYAGLVESAGVDGYRATLPVRLA